MNENKLKLKTLVDYLNSPLQTKVKLIFDNYDDEEKLSTQYEPFVISPLTKWKIKNILINEILENNLLDTNCDIDKNELLKSKRKSALLNLLPRQKDKDILNDPLLNLSFNKSIKEIQDLLKNFFNLFNTKPTKDNILIFSPETTINQYNLIQNNTDVLYLEKDNTLNFFELKAPNDNQHLKDFTNLYIQSLIYIYSLKEKGEKEYTINLFRDIKKTINFKITSFKAKEILEKIVKNITDQKNYKYIDTKDKDIVKDYEIIKNNLNDDNTYKDIKNGTVSSLTSILNSAKSNDFSNWSYYTDAKLFNNINKLGYSNDENFEQEYINALKEYTKLIEPLLDAILIKNERKKKGK